MFDLVHTRAVLMHIPVDDELLERMVSWLRPGRWLLLEEPDFGPWMADANAAWASHADVWHRTFPSGSVDRGRSLLRQIATLGLDDVGAIAEVDIVHPGNPLAEFYRLASAAIAPPAVDAGVLTAEQAAAFVEDAERPGPKCGFVHIGVWGRKRSTTWLN